MASTLCQKMVDHFFFFCQKFKIWFSSEHTILFKFHQHVVQITIYLTTISRFKGYVVCGWNDSMDDWVSIPAEHWGSARLCHSSKTTGKAISFPVSTSFLPLYCHPVIFMFDEGEAPVLGFIRRCGINYYSTTYSVTFLILAKISSSFLFLGIPPTKSL